MKPSQSPSQSPSAQMLALAPCVLCSGRATIRTISCVENSLTLARVWRRDGKTNAGEVGSRRSHYVSIRGGSEGRSCHDTSSPVELNLESLVVPFEVEDNLRPRISDDLVGDAGNILSDHRHSVDADQHISRNDGVRGLCRTSAEDPHDGWHQALVVCSDDKTNANLVGANQVSLLSNLSEPQDLSLVCFKLALPRISLLLYLGVLDLDIVQDFLELCDRDGRLNGDHLIDRAGHWCS
mmetsp:Transcript_12224/g.28196  ORF Transcript_12224/g.28196 Transcript_12224/m.28196 type:complete len:238 (+) Transcript_12224:42-755(+)